MLVILGGPLRVWLRKSLWKKIAGTHSLLEQARERVASKSLPLISERSDGSLDLLFGFSESGLLSDKRAL